MPAQKRKRREETQMSNSLDQEKETFNQGLHGKQMYGHDLNICELHKSSIEDDLL